MIARNSYSLPEHTGAFMYYCLHRTLPQDGILQEGSGNVFLSKHFTSPAVAVFCRENIVESFLFVLRQTEMLFARLLVSG
jgi:hypothetical protein